LHYADSSNACRPRFKRAAALLAVVLPAVVLPAASWSEAAPPAAAPPGEQLFEQHCAGCHDAPVGRIPSREQLRRHSPAEVFQALRAGVMREQAKGLAVYQMQLITGYLTGEEPGEVRAAEPESNPCKGAPAPLDLTGSDWNGWARDAGNARYQPHPGFTAADLPRLQLKWAYGYHGSYTYGQPVVVAGRLFTGSSTGRVYALDARSGCTYFTFDADSSVRTAMVVAIMPAVAAHRRAVIFGDDAAHVYALDAASGELLWKVKVDVHPVARISGAPKVLGTRIYVPISSLEELAATDPKYPCCTFAGKVMALDLATGRTLWTARMTAEAKPLADEDGASNAAPNGTQHFGPAGSSVWNSPTIDEARGRLYVATGNSYTNVKTATSDSVVAIKLADGAILWSSQLTPDDNFTVGCPTVNCPRNPGPDVDFGASVILHRAPRGRSVLLASQKSGEVYALDTERGRVLWKVRLSEGSPLGGIEWGSAADEAALYVPISDALLPPAKAAPGLSALSIASGKLKWRVNAPTPACAWDEQSNCRHAFQQAATVMPGAVFAGALDGHLRAYATNNGTLLWDYDTARSYQAVNALPTEGGSLDLGGAVIAEGMLFINSGYGRLIGKPGNALLAFSIDAR
jgi:polyvinyl alcohol dehydrogenase (cytochrome)